MIEGKAPQLELVPPPIERIRRATPGDLPALTELVDTSMRRLSDGYTPRQIESALLFITHVDARLITDGTYFVAETAAGIVGTAGWTRRPMQHGVVHAEHAASYERWLDQHLDAARIRSVYVHPDWARRGIGRRLLEMCERAAYHAGAVGLALLASTGGAALYRACGYAALGQLDFVLPDRTVLPLVPMHRPPGLKPGAEET